MHRKNYVELAGMIRDLMVEKPSFSLFVDRLCLVLKKDNPRFNPQKFKDAIYDGDL